MTRKEALTDLLAQVEAGENLLLGGTAKFYVLGSGNIFRAASAYTGSLDAAKALRLAVIPFPVPEIMFSDARKELIAIIKYLIAREQP